jgi:hypothetical protein
MKASRLFKWLLTCLLLSVVIAVALFLGFTSLKPLLFVTVLAGVVLVFTGVGMLATGHLDDDVTKRH